MAIGFCKKKSGKHITDRQEDSFLRRMLQADSEGRNLCGLL